MLHLLVDSTIDNVGGRREQIYGKSLNCRLFIHNFLTVKCVIASLYACNVRKE